VPIDADAAERIRELEGRLRVIASSMRAFAEATTDYQLLLDVVARRLAEVVKDGCVLRLLDDEGWLTPVAIHLPLEGRIHDADVLEHLRSHVARPQLAAAQESARRVLESGEGLVIPKLDMALLRATSDREIADAYEAIGIHSVLLVPLRARGASIGLLALVAVRPGLTGVHAIGPRPRTGAGGQRGDGSQQREVVSIRVE